jgi:hypothetical protein
MAVPRLSRRTLLRGLGGVAIALPTLECMLPSRAQAQSAAIPNRFVVSYGGTSIGADGSGELFVPSMSGAGYPLTRGLQPLGDLGVQNDFSVVTGLKIPWGAPGAIPPGGKTVAFHYNTVGPQLAGTQAGDSAGGADGRPRGPTCDQLVADAIAGSTVQKVLTYRVQAASYVLDQGVGNNTNGESLTLSWKNESGSLVGQDPTFSPQLAFQSLFSGFVPTDAQQAAKAQAELRRRKSILDLVASNTQRLVPKLGANDKLRLQQHLDEIRALETRISAMPPPTPICVLPSDPGPDPAIAGASDLYFGCGNPMNQFIATAGYSNEDHRSDVLTDLIAMAFACDLSRVASFMLTEWKAYMNMTQLTPFTGEMHSFTHEPNVEGVADTLAWHVKQVARLASKLKAITLPDGTTILDHTAMVLLFEGGYGFSPESNSDGSPHSTENMVALVGGRAGGLKPGKHIVATDKHPANCVVAAMNAAGCSGGLGDITDGLPELFS